MAMIPSIGFSRRLGALALVVGLFAVAPVLEAAPKLKGASLRCASSPRLPVGEWVSLQYHLENPDPRAVTLRLSLRAGERGRAVFEKLVTLGPRTQLRGRELVVADVAATYVLSVFLGAERLQREEIPVNSTDQPTRATLMVVNDAPEFAGAGELTKPGLLRDAVGLINANARSLPEHWFGYGQTRVVVVGSPSYRDISAAQFGALAAYVQRGGTAVFVHPEGALAAAATPWAALLPVLPLRVRLTETLPELDAWGAAWADSQPAAQRSARRPLADRDGFGLLESSERGEGLTTLGSETQPLIRWRRCGLGRVGVVAVDALHRRLVESGVLAPLWNHILGQAQPVSATGNLENSFILPTVLAHLTGFRISSAEAVGRLLLGYVVCLLAVLLAGVAWRRHVLSWLVAATLGLALTAVIFAWAFRQNAARPAASAAILDLCTSGGERSSGQAVVSLFAKRDLRPAIHALDAATALRPLPSPARGKRREPLDAPLIVQREADLAGLSGITVQALKPREFVALYELPPLPVTAITVSLGEAGATVREGVLPAVLGSPSARAFLLVAGGLLPLRREGLRLVGLEAGGRWLDTDPFLTDLARYLVEGAFPRPAVVVLQPWSEAGSAALPLDVTGFVQEGYRVTLLPVALECSGGRVTLAPEFVRLEPRRTSPRLALLADDTWQSAVLRANQTVQAFDVVLPTIVADLRPDAVTVEVDFANTGGNLSLEVRLQPTPSALSSSESDAAGLAAWQTALPASAAEGGRYRFEGPATAALAQPTSGRLRLLLRVSQKQIVTLAQDADRSNRWRLNRLRVTLAGTLPKADQIRRF
jgi:hypothetical protein